MIDFGYRVIRFFRIFSNTLIIVGLAALISLFFSPTFPLWRILIGVIPLGTGILIKSILTILLRFIGIGSHISESIKNIKNDIEN